MRPSKRHGFNQNEAILRAPLLTTSLWRLEQADPPHGTVNALAIQGSTSRSPSHMSSSTDGLPHVDITLESFCMRVFLVVLCAFLGSSSAVAGSALQLDAALLEASAALLHADGGETNASAPGLQTSLSGLPVLGVGHNTISAPSAHAGTFGIGLQVGSPTALTLKFGGPHDSGVALGLGAGFGYGNAFGASLWLHADYLFHFATLLDGDGLDLSLYGGPGLFATIFGSNYGFGYRDRPYYRDFDGVGFGVRLPVGISAAFDALPLEVYLQLDPALSLFPGIGFGIGGSLGFRFYF